MASVFVTGVTAAAESLVPKVVAALETVTSLEGVLQWADSQTPRREVVDIVTQDEYTHDVVLSWEDDWYLVLDVTWLGALAAVAVWDHRPTAAEMLEARLAGGWQPTATGLKGGDQVLGYAACVFEDPDMKARVRTADA